MIENEILFPTDLFDLEQDNRTQRERFSLREGELREVTVLFADIKGFTSMSTHFDPEIVHAKMDELMKVFSRCVTFYGGFVDKYIGDSIMALFGAKKASEQDTERAIRAAFKMQQQMKLYNDYLRRQPGFEEVELNIRIGINTGVVSVGKVGESREGDFTVYGPEVNLASRMESNAPVGGIMVPEPTKKMVEHIFDFNSLGQKSVKGIDAPVSCWQPVGLKLVAAQRWQRSGGSFIGREEELAFLAGALDRIRDEERPGSGFTEALPPPRPLLVGINADAGLGKTRLIYEFQRLHETGAVYVKGTCTGISPTPLNLFANLFESWFALRVNEPVEDKRQKLERGFARLAEGCEAETRPGLDDAFPLIAFLLEIRTEDPRLRQTGKDLLQHLMQAVHAVLDGILESSRGLNKPLVFILDDLHWMDDSSSAALEHIINRFAQSDLPTLWILAYRNEFKVPGYLKRMRGFSEIELMPLSGPDIAKLILNYSKQLELSEATIDKVAELSAGNPFYLEEWCNYIADLGDSHLQEIPVPANLNSLILSRLDSLPQALRQLLQKAAVIGQEFFVDILTQVEKRLSDSADVEAILPQLEEQALIMKMLGFDFSSYFFKHITTREVAYHTLLQANRKLLHQLTAESIEELFGTRIEEFHYALAEHYYRAELPEKAIPHTTKAADAAARIFDNGNAIRLYNRLLEIIPEADLAARGDTLLKMIEVQWLNGDWNDAARNLEALSKAAGKASDLKLEFHVHRYRGLLHFHRRQLDEAKAEWDKCLELLGQVRDPLLESMIANFLGIWHQERGDRESALSFYQRSLELARSLGDIQRQAKTLNNLGLLALAQGDHSGGEALFSQSLDLARSQRYQKDESIAVGNIGHARMVQGRFAEALPFLEEKLALADKMNDKVELIKALGNIGRVRQELGMLPEAIACYSRIVRIKEYLGDAEGAQNTRQYIEELSSEAEGA
jgi:class 3 adenylate cyclase/tetratricopeptide (TPR) repeat protein